MLTRTHTSHILPPGSERNRSWKLLCPVSWSREEEEDEERRVVRRPDSEDLTV